MNVSIRRCNGSGNAVADQARVREVSEKDVLAVLSWSELRQPAPIKATTADRDHEGALDRR